MTSLKLILLRFIGISFMMILSLTFTANAQTNSNKTLLKGARLIDGNGGKPLENTDILIEGETIAMIGTNLKIAGARIIDLKGKTIMPAMVSAHVHVGVIKGNEQGGRFYTRENILSQLKKYQDYGISNVLAMGSDRPLIFEKGIRDSSVAGLLPGARFYSAGYGFNVPDASVKPESFLGNLYRPATASEVPGMMDQVAKLKPEMIKVWVDGPPATKMKPEIYKSIINEAHKHNLRVLAHVYNLSDARNLVASGLDIFGHSVRDSVFDDALIAQMKSKNIPYIPTLALDKMAYVYAQNPAWMKDEFFTKALEPGVYEMITSEKYQTDLKNSPAYARSIAGSEIALKNVKKLHDAGILIALGTDSGAFPIRAQGFAEHLELELLVEAGFTPLQAITVATRNAARVMRIENKFGTLEKGKSADLVILSSNPALNIKNTRTIEAVYKAGKEVSNGPLK
jgi:imidazolonepropionase-like amidohydrolase